MEPIRTCFYGRDGVGSNGYELNPAFSHHWSPNLRHVIQHLGCLQTEDGNSAYSVVLCLRSKEVNEVMHEDGLSWSSAQENRLKSLPGWHKYSALFGKHYFAPRN